MLQYLETPDGIAWFRPSRNMLPRSSVEKLLQLLTISEIQDPDVQAYHRY